MKENFVHNIRRFFSYLFPLFFLESCSTYHQKALTFQRDLQYEEPAHALSSLEEIKILKKKRNELLYLLEKGKLEYLNGRPKESNKFFNEADRQIEDLHTHLASQLLSYLINPEVAPYRPEDFEKVTIHYYKALNYLVLQAYDEALVEAKRINIELQKINEKYPEGEKNRYTSDAFSLILQGLIYEATAIKMMLSFLTEML